MRTSEICLDDQAVERLALVGIYRFLLLCFLLLVVRILIGLLHAWHSMHKGYTVPDVVTGKPLSMGGSFGRREATGRGCVYTICNATRHLERDLSEAHVVVQGFGNVGAVVAQLLQEIGCRVIAVSDIQGGLYNARGLSIPELLRYQQEYDSVSTYPRGERISNEELLELPCDILVPAAVESQITEANAARVQASMIVEAANGPVTPEADAILEDSNIVVIPDILANAGGVTVSYFEWVQNRQEFRWREAQVNRHLKAVMATAFTHVWAIAQRECTSLRQAAYRLGIGRVVQAIKDRGIYP